VIRALAIGALCALAVPAAAQGLTLRAATVAPEGSSWVNLIQSYGRELDAATRGAVKVKWFFGGILGDELELLERVKKGQLDVIASGGMACQRTAPSLRIQGLPGVFQSRDEVVYVMERLRPVLYAEAERAGFAMLMTTGLGPEVIFSREPVRSMADLRRVRLWRWSGDEIGIGMSNEMGLHVVPAGVAEGSRAYDEGRIDGFVAVPSAALAYQWSALARYVTDLRVGYLTGCILVRQAALDRVPFKEQQIIRALMAKYDARFEDNGRRQDEALLGGLFERQGLRPVPPSEVFRAEFFETARAARERHGDQVVPRALIDRVLRMLADYRLEHPTANR
jgi:TRAP-type C4-dicarboxylate transport system substrate-binding protein